MRFVDRGPEPNGVAGYAQQFTPGWVAYFQNDVGGRPTDSYWREFRSTLGNRSNNICWYCERECDAAGDLAPTVDHFRPISRFPQFAYEWSNWIFSCQRCNVCKANRWPESGYVDPCAADIAERPEQYFDYNFDYTEDSGHDKDNGNIVPKNGLSEAAWRKAQNTIDDLGLNKLDVRFWRLDWTRGFVADLLELPAADREAHIAVVVEQSVEYAGVTGMVVEQLRRDGRI